MHTLELRSIDLLPRWTGLVQHTGADTERHAPAEIGHAVGWTSVMAYSWEQNSAVGVVLGRDWRDDDIDALLHDLMALRIG